VDAPVTRPVHRQFASFAVIGGLGFLVDAGVLSLLMRAGTGFHAGRLFSFLVAVTFTWFMNRQHSFHPRGGEPLWHEWLRYLLAMTLGGSFNLACSFASYHWLPLAQRWPVLAVAVGSVAGMLVNFVTARQFVFRRG
jgi:putative flippase GtrA